MLDNYFNQIKKYRGIIPAILVTARNYAVIQPTLYKLFGDLPLVKLQSASTRFSIQNNPHAFVAHFKTGVMIEGLHLYPELLDPILNSIQKSKDGPYVLMSPYYNAQWSQSAATHKLKLIHLPFNGVSLAELKGEEYLPESLFTWGPDYLINHVVAQASDFYFNYFDQLLADEILPELRLKYPHSFLKFLGLMAEKTATPVHFAEIAQACDVSVNTIIQWTQILEQKGWIYKLTNYTKAWNKRLIKHDKFHFNDIGLMTHLFQNFGDTQKQDFFDQQRFVNVITNDMRINLLKLKTPPKLHFWHDHKGRGISCVVETPKKLLLTHILPHNLDEGFDKALHTDMKLVKKLSKNPRKNCFIVHRGNKSYEHLLGDVLSWKDV